jgi:hypothetical protein
MHIVIHSCTVTVNHSRNSGVSGMSFYVSSMAATEQHEKWILLAFTGPPRSTST